MIYEPCTVRSPRIHVYTSDVDRVLDIREMLESANYETSCSTLPGVVTSEAVENVDLILLDGPAHSENRVISFCEELQHRMAERFVPVIFVADDAGPVLRVFTSRVGTDGHVIRPVDPVVLLSQVQALLRVKFLQDKLIDQSRELERANHRIELAYEQVDRELSLASKIQRSMLPHRMPTFGDYKFAAKLAVSSRVSGDAYDFVALDDEHLGFYVADAMGHGVPAGLLTIFIKKGIQTHEDHPTGRAIYSPGQVLEKLNSDIVHQDLSESPFVTMAYFTLNRVTGELRHARGGHPFPIILRADGSTEELMADGSLLGVFETNFETQSTFLNAGDKLIIYTDGIDNVRYESHSKGPASFIACVEAHRHRPIEDIVEGVYRTLFGTHRHEDDFTFLGVEAPSV